MDVIDVNGITQIPVDEISWKFSRSSGPGGQNVNKVSSKAMLEFDVMNSPSLTGEQKARIIDRIPQLRRTHGKLRIQVHAERSQLRNRQIAMDRLADRLASALSEQKERAETSPPAAAAEKRLRRKKERGRIKELRIGHHWDGESDR